MTLFSLKRFSLFLRLEIVLVFLIGLSATLSQSLLAQSSEDLFKGTWQIDTPEEGALILVIKNQGLASYFWGDNTDRTVYQGTWELEGESASLKWADGSSHRIQRDNLGFIITYNSITGAKVYEAKAQQVPAEVLGVWAKPPDADKAITSDRDKAKGFFGTWKIDDSASGSQYIFIESDRSAASTQGNSIGLRGSWAKQGSELHIAWDSGQYSILRENERGFTYKTIPAGAIIEDDESELSAIERTVASKVPAAWYDNYKAERELFKTGIAFPSRKAALAFYRGSWILRTAEDRFERIELSRFGGLSTTRDRSLEGDWRMQGQDIFMRWDDGQRKILSPIGRGFLVSEFRPGRPLDGVPTRVYSAAPTDASKLAQHLAGREDVATQMLALAEATGIQSSGQEKAGWGRTFARWAWPFGEDGNNTENVLDEAYASDASDPWWWPFWNETSTSKASTSKTNLEETTAQAPLPEAAEPEETQVVEKEKSTAPKSKMDKAKDWVWPF